MQSFKVNGYGYQLSKPLSEMKPSELKSMITSDTIFISKAGSKFMYDDESQCIMSTKGTNYFIRDAFGLGLSDEKCQWIEIKIEEGQSVSNSVDIVMAPSEEDEVIETLKFDTLDDLIEHLIEARSNYVIVTSLD